MKLSPQENKIVTFLANKREVFWEELAQFCKNPSTVKLKTVQKAISDLKKKFKDNNIQIPFECVFKELTLPSLPKMSATSETTDFNGQTLVKITRNRDNTKEQVNSTVLHDVVVESKDFIVKSFARQIITKTGLYTLSGEEFEVFDYLINNRGRFVSLVELRDKVCYPKFGSKTPSRWFFSIQRRISNIRRQIPESRAALLTAKQYNDTGYIFN